MLKRWGNYELSIDFRQWIIGFNFYNGFPSEELNSWNIFFLCIRLGKDCLPSVSQTY